MSEKSEQKKKLILETARKVFVEKGYKLVTMKDIVEACEISRGGLYLYFQSTSVDKVMNINRSSYLTLHLVLHLLYDGYINYLNSGEAAER